MKSVMPLRQAYPMIAFEAAQDVGSAKLAALLAEKPGRYHAILAHLDKPNENGHVIPIGEAKRWVKKALQFDVNLRFGPIKKSDDQHSDDTKDIVARSLAFDVVEGPVPRIEYVAEFDLVTEWDMKAYKLVKEGRYPLNSVELGFAEGECSQCHATFRNPSQCCSHLVRRGGFVYGTDRAAVIFHEISITGASLLRRDAGDPEARILAVATKQETKEGKVEIEEKKYNELVAQAAKAADVEALQKRVTDLEAERDAAKGEKTTIEAELATARADLTAAQAKLAEHAKAERVKRCEKILADRETKMGKKVENRQAEIDKLMAKDDTYLAAQEDLLAEMAEVKKDDPPPTEDPLKANASKAEKPPEPLDAQDPKPGAEIKTAVDEFIAAKHEK